MKLCIQYARTKRYITELKDVVVYYREVTTADLSNGTLTIKNSNLQTKLDRILKVAYQQIATYQNDPLPKHIFTKTSRTNERHSQ